MYKDDEGGLPYVEDDGLSELRLEVTLHLNVKGSSVRNSVSRITQKLTAK